MNAGMDRIDPATTIGDVHLTISDLDRSIAFYTERLGFRVHRRDSNSAVLGAGGVDMLALMQSPGAPRVRGTTGLYHFRDPGALSRGSQRRCAG